LHGKYNGVFAIYRTFGSVDVTSGAINNLLILEQMTGLVDEELASHYPPSLKFICHNGAGYDQVDVPACTKRGISTPQNCLTLGIKVSNTPGAVVAATADVGIFLLIGALRNFNHGMMKLRRGAAPSDTEF